PQLRSWFDGFRFRRCERLHKRLLEIVNVFKVLYRILLGFPENAGTDQVKYHMPDVFAGTDSPAIEHGHHHWAEFLERVLPDAIEQFRAGYMTHTDALGFLLLLGRKVERVAQKDIPLPLIARVAAHNRLESLGESNFLHRWKARVSKRAGKDNRQCRKGQLPSGKRGRR